MSSRSRSATCSLPGSPGWRSTRRTALRVRGRAAFLDQRAKFQRLSVFHSIFSVPVDLRLELGRDGRRQLFRSRRTRGGLDAEAVPFDRPVRILFTSGAEIRITPTAETIRIESHFHHPRPVRGAAPIEPFILTVQEIPEDGQRLRSLDASWDIATSGRQMMTQSAHTRLALRRRIGELRSSLAAAARPAEASPDKSKRTPPGLLATATIVDMSTTSRRVLRADPDLGIAITAVHYTNPPHQASLWIGPADPTGLFGMDTGAADELRLPVVEVEREVMAIRYAFDAMPPWRRALLLARRCALEIAFAVEAFGFHLAARRERRRASRTRGAADAPARAGVAEVL